MSVLIAATVLLVPALGWSPVVVLENHLPAGATIPPAVSVVAVSQDDPATVVRAVATGGTAHPSLGPGKWTITCQNEDLWCPTLTLDSSAAPDSIALPFFQAAMLSATIVSTPGQVLPGTVVVLSVGKAGDGTAVDLRQDTPVKRDHISVRVPRGTMDLRLVGGGFAPAYLWDVDSRRRRVDLGHVTLVAGASVSGRLVDPDTNHGLAGVAAKLSASGRAESDQEAQRLSRMRFEAMSDSRGFFQLSGVPPGNYRLDAAGADRVASGLDTVEVHAHEETRLGDLSMARLATLRVVIDPPSHPVGGGWVLMLVPVAGGPELHASADPNGFAHLKGVAPGSYTMFVSAQATARLAYVEVTVRGDQEVPVSVPLTRVRGTVRLGDRPINAEVRLMAGRGDEVVLHSDQEGHFDGWMRRSEPPFPILIARLSGAEIGRSRRMDITNPEEREGVLILDLRISERALQGRVLDEHGTPVPGVSVRAEVVGSDFLETVSDGEGSFRFVGLDKHAYTVFAHDSETTTDSVQVDASVEGDLPQVSLVFSSRKQLDGVVLSSDGLPVPGAGVDVLPAGRMRSRYRQHTDAAGRFRETVPKELKQAVVVVMAPSQELWSACVEVPDEGVLTLHLPSLPSGTLEIRTHGDPAKPPARGGRLVVFTREGGFIDRSQLAAWALETTGRYESQATEGSPGEGTLELPRMAPSDYAIAWSGTPTPDIAAATCAGGPPLGLEWTSVPPAGRGTLAFDLSKVQ